MVADRFVDSSLAYQGGARGLGVEVVWQADAGAVADYMPDLTCAARPARRGAWRRGAPRDRIEGEGLALRVRVAEGYREVAERFPSGCDRDRRRAAAEEVHDAGAGPWSPALA